MAKFVNYCPKCDRVVRHPEIPMGLLKRCPLCETRIYRAEVRIHPSTVLGIISLILTYPIFMAVFFIVLDAPRSEESSITYYFLAPVFLLITGIVLAVYGQRARMEKIRNLFYTNKEQYDNEMIKQECEDRPQKKDRRCVECGRGIPFDALFCQYCGHEYRK